MPSAALVRIAPGTKVSSDRTAILRHLDRLARRSVFVNPDHAASTPIGLATDTLEADLAADAGLDLGDGIQPCRRDRLGALDADAVFALVQAVQRRGQALHPLQEQLTGDQANVPTRGGLDLIDLVGERRALADRAGQLRNHDRPSELAKSGESGGKVPFNPCSDVRTNDRVQRVHALTIVDALGPAYWTLDHRRGYSGRNSRGVSRAAGRAAYRTKYRSIPSSIARGNDGTGPTSCRS